MPIRFVPRTDDVIVPPRMPRYRRAVAALGLFGAVLGSGIGTSIGSAQLTGTAAVQANGIGQSQGAARLTPDYNIVVARRVRPFPVPQVIIPFRHSKGWLPSAAGPPTLSARGIGLGVGAASLTGSAAGRAAGIGLSRGSASLNDSTPIVIARRTRFYPVTRVLSRPPPSKGWLTGLLAGGQGNLLAVGIGQSAGVAGYVSADAIGVGGPPTRYFLGDEILVPPPRSKGWLQSAPPALAFPGIGFSVGVAQLTAGGALVPAGIGQSEGVAVPTGVGAVQAAGVGQSVGVAVVSSLAGGAIAGIGQSLGVARLTGTGALVPQGVGASVGTAALVGQQAVVASGIGLSVGWVTLSPVIAPATGIGLSVGAAVLTGTGDLSASGVGISCGASQIQAPITIRAAGIGFSIGSAGTQFRPAVVRGQRATITVPGLRSATLTVPGLRDADLDGVG